MTKGRKAGRIARQGFLEALRRGMTITAAAEAIGVDRSTPFNWRRKNPAYAALWEVALDEGTDRLEDEALRRARRPRKFREHLSRHDNDDFSGLAACLEAARKRIAA